MPEEKICPVVESYVRHTMRYWQAVRSPILEIYGHSLEGIEELKDSPNALVCDLTTQKLRAFYCLHGLFALMRGKIGGPAQKLPLTREGIQSLIAFCRETRDATEVKLYVAQLTSAQGWTKLLSLEADTIIGLTDTIVDAAEYFRPRLSTEGPLSGMGRFYAQGLMAVKASPENFLQHGRELLNVSMMSGGDLT